MRRVFISHAWNESESFEALKELLGRHDFAFYDHSVSASDPLDVPGEAELRRRLSEKISQVSTVVLLVAEDAHKRDFIKHEIEEAVKQGKRLVAVQPLGRAHAPVPRIIEENAHAIVGFRGRQIIDAIEGHDIRNLPEHLVSEQEDLANIGHWIARCALGAVIVCAIDSEAVVPKLNAVLVKMGYELCWKEDPPRSADVVNDMLIGAGFGLAAGLLFGGRWVLTLPLLGAAAAGVACVGKSLVMSRVITTDGVYVSYRPAW